MKTFIFLYVAVLFNLPTDNFSLPLLSSDSQKSWQITSSSMPEDRSSCQPMGTVMFDNTWTFYADGSFEFDHGDVTEDPDCMEQGCCSDFVNMVGSWEYDETNNSLQIITDHEKGNPSNAFNDVLVEGAIEFEGEDSFKIEAKDPDTGEVYVYQFEAVKE